MLVSDFDFQLPAEQIAQRPLQARDASRMLVLHRDSGRAEDRKFAEFPKLLRGDELLVINNARVIPARLLGRRVDTASGSDTEARSSNAGEVEVLLSRRLDDVNLGGTGASGPEDAGWAAGAIRRRRTGGGSCCARRSRPAHFALLVANQRKSSGPSGASGPRSAATVH